MIREKRRTTTVAAPGSPIAQTDRGRHSRPGGDEPYEPVVLHARIINRASERPELGGGLKGWALHDWLQTEREIRESRVRHAQGTVRKGG